MLATGIALTLVVLGVAFLGIVAGFEPIVVRADFHPEAMEVAYGLRTPLVGTGLLLLAAGLWIGSALRRRRTTTVFLLIPPFPSHAGIELHQEHTFAAAAGKKVVVDVSFHTVEVTIQPGSTVEVPVDLEAGGPLETFSANASSGSIKILGMARSAGIDRVQPNRVIH